MFEAAGERYLTGKNPKKRLIDNFYTVSSQFNPIHQLINVPGVNAALTYMIDYDFWRKKSVWTGDKMISDVKKHYPDIDPIWLELSDNKTARLVSEFSGDGTGLKPQALKIASQKLLTSGNMWTELGLTAIKRQMVGMEEKEKDDLSNKYMDALEKSFFSRKYLKKQTHMVKN